MSKNTAAVEPKIVIDSEVTRCIRQHARAHMKTEVCGVLIGEKVGDAVQIRASIEASQASQGGTHVTFTQEAWEEIYRVKDVRYPEERIVGWYHSHPGFGVFLSEHDLFIQQNFFNAPDQVAWVYDPHTDEEGCFGWVGGAVHRIHSLTISDQNGDGVERTPKPTEMQVTEEESVSQPVMRAEVRQKTPEWMRWAATGMLSLTMLVAGFAVSYFLFPQIIPFAVFIDPTSGRPLGIREAPELLPFLHKALLAPESSAVPTGQSPALTAPAPAPGASTAAPPQAPASSTPAPATGRKP
ncbi:hypothetical protein FTW19_04355 [Terriglobus albidus]|uniref:MPN domain-containing protein n=1 Tax=Terriglobus albidus TaxID=1592106 RepID=A0A5B9E9L5_9BACT|nr:Mov34/MPN/PAD-1 family protein [Terriglobus albidus]QEE27310.1 hypothetical protein FTW19_04355 [Terriglobus albidus]